MSQRDLFDQPGTGRADQAARDAISRALTQNFVVKAGAGAGKTHELLGRMVACVRRGACSVDQMVAITFTRKAAGELKQRFAAALEEGREQALGVEAERLEQAVHKVDECFIGTIHAFCGRLLRERPVEAGLPPDFVELDERDDVAVRDDVWNQFIEELYRENGILLQGLVEVGVKPHDLTSFFRTRYEFADLALKPTVAVEPDLSEAVTRAGELIQASLPYLPRSWADEDDFTRMARRAELSISRDGLASTLRQAEFLRAVDAGTSRPEKVTMSRWRDKAIAREFRNDRIPAMRQSLEPAITAWREFVYTRVAPVADAAVKYYERYRRQNGLVTFYDLLERTVALVRDHPKVRLHFQDRYRRLFVDEFQDTDPMQAQMLLLLSSVNPETRDWTKVVPRPGSLFIVGDEKQSIYRFRRADIETFRAVSDQIEHHGGRVVHLTTSFRTRANLCKTLNDIFERVFIDDSTEEFQAPFAPLLPERAPGRDRMGVRRIDTSEREKSRKTADVEAEVIGDFIAAAIAGTTEYNGATAAADDDGSVFGCQAVPSDFLIVARERANLGSYARALEERRIPYDISGGDALGKSEELGLLIDILAVVERPGNPVAYLKYLRGPLVGLSDQVLYDFRRSGGRFNYRSPLTDESRAINTEIVDALARLRYADELLTSRPVYSAILEIVDYFGIAVFGATLDGGTLRAGSVMRVLSYVRQWANEGKGWTTVLNELRGLVRDTVGTIETMTLEVGRPDVVRIMTVHQAKGLEAPVVILADADRSSGGTWIEPHVTRVGGTPTLSMAVEKSRQIIAQPVGWSDDAEREQQFRNAEEDRIRYVGATRARNLVVACEHKARGFWSKFSVRTGAARELERFVDVARPTTSVATVDLQRIQTARNQRRAVSGTASLRYETITGADSDSPFVPVTAGGRGPLYGSAVHEILEAIVRNTEVVPLGGYVAAVLGRHLETGVDDEAIESVIRGVSALRESELWDRLCRATDVYTEVPVLVASDDTLSTGTIDLVMRTDAGWEILDYKTDFAETAADKRALQAAYGPQVREYCHLWNRTTGENVARSGLWLFGPGVYMPVEVPPPEVTGESPGESPGESHQATAQEHQ